MPWDKIPTTDKKETSQSKSKLKSLQKHAESMEAPTTDIEQTYVRNCNKPP